ncbi:MAG: 4Fe-4S dicluster domain-containing protein [Fervidicoccaceae archaeon]
MVPKSKVVKEISRLGGIGLLKCYQCGLCTAICPISEIFQSSFRRTIRYAQLGIANRIISDPTPWLCHGCGECTASCPREANPGDVMAAVRRYQTIQFSPGRVASLFNFGRTSIPLILFISFFASAALYLLRGTPNMSEVNIYSLIPYSTIHALGVILAAFILVIAAYSLLQMYRKLGRIKEHPKSVGSMEKISKLLSVIILAGLIQLNFKRCSNYLSRYIAHLSIFWGFIGLFVASSIHYVSDIFALGISSYVPRAVGLISGAFLIYGSSYYIYKRLRKDEAFIRQSTYSDWLFLILLLIAGITGFLLDAFIYFNIPLAAYFTYAAHLISVFDLIVLAPFTKFAHSVYRPIAIWINEIRGANP